MSFKVDKVTCYKIVAHFKKMGLLPGTNDLVIVHNGKYYGIEVKTDKGIQKPDQIRFEKNIIKAGGKYEIVRSVEDVVEVLREWEIIS